MNPDEELYNSSPQDFYNYIPNDYFVLNPPRPSVLMEPKKQKYRNYYNSKWANLKFFLQDKASLEASVDLLKTKTVEQFSTKCREIYAKKIEIQLATEKNRRLIQQKIVDKSEYDNSSSKFEVSDGCSGLPTDAVQTFLFMFRENNHLMLKLIDHIDSRNIVILVPFLCHFFYENFYMESNLNEKMPNKEYKDINQPAGLKASAKLEFNVTFKNEQKAFTSKTFLKRSTAILGMKTNNSQLIDFLPADAKFNLSENQLLELYHKEKNNIIKQFLYKHIKKTKKEKNSNLFDCSYIMEYLKKINE